MKKLSNSASPHTGVKCAPPNAGTKHLKEPVGAMAAKILARGTTLAIVVILAFGLGKAQANPLTTDPAGTVPDAIKSNFDIEAVSVEQFALSLGKFPRSSVQEIKKVDAKATPDQGQAARGWFSFSRHPSLSRDSPDETSASGTSADSIPPLPAGTNSLLPDERTEPDSLQVGNFHASSSDAPTNYFAEELPNEQAAPPQPSAPDVKTDATRIVNPEPAIPPVNPDINGPVTFSKLGMPRISGADDAAVSGEVADGVVLSAPNNEVVTVDPAGSNINILDLIGGDDAPLDAHQALMELDIRHALLDVRDTLSDIRAAVTDNVLVNFTRRVAEPGGPAPQSAGTGGADDERAPSSNYAADDHNQFANKIIQEIVVISITIRNYFWLFAPISLFALMLRWALTRR